MNKKDRVSTVRKHRLPKTCYVKLDGDGEDQFLAASDEVDGEHGDRVGVYKLVAVKKIKNTIELV